MKLIINKNKMHIPNQMIDGTVCPVTATISIVGIAAAVYFAHKSKQKPTATKFAAIAAFIFAAQMINFPILSGTSGHLIGATLATALLGGSFGILAMAIVLSIQALFFADGGLAVLGANILNMAIIGSFAGIIANKYFPKNYLILGVAAWMSVVMASLACSIELALAGTISFSAVIPSMIGIRAIIGLGEVAITLAVYSVFASEILTNSKKISFGIPLLSAGAIGLLLSPFASSYPDGLEWVAAKYNILHESAPTFVSIMPDYSIPFLENSTGLAGLLGVAIIFLLSWMLVKVSSRWSPT